MTFHTTRQSRILSTIILMAMVLSFAVKVAIPAGFMPETKGGMTAMVICSGMGEKTIMVPSDDSAPSQTDNHKTDVCSYAVSGGQKILQATPPDMPVGDNALLDNAVAFKDAVFVAAVQRSLPARGPPLLV